MTTRNPGAEKTASVRGEIRSHKSEGLKELWQSFEERIAPLYEELFHETAFAAPIHRLPPELLSQIFVEYTYNVSGSPWNLIFVCRLWKEVAFDLALLWVRILCRHWSLASDHVRLDGREVCNTPLRLKKTLERTKNLPLDIKIDIHGDMGNESGRRMLELLRGSMSQWRRLELVALELPSTAGPVPHLVGDLTCLEEARLWAGVPPLMKSMEVSATSLRKLTVGQAAKFHRYAANPRWAQLTYFALDDNCHMKRKNKSRETYSKVLPTYIRLQVLHIHATPWTLAAAYFPPSLRECRLRSSNVTLSQAHFPRLTLLCLDNHVSIPQTTVHFPQLRTLEFIGPKGLDRLAVFTAPVLHTMKIDCEHGNQDIGRLWGKEGEAANSLLPRVLYLRNSSVSTNVIIAALRVLRDLEELYLTASPAAEKQQFYRSLLPSKQGERYRILAPKLRTLVVDMDVPYLRRSTPNSERERALWDAMVKLAVQRKARDVGIDSFRIRATALFDGKWVDVRPDASLEEYLDLTFALKALKRRGTKRESRDK